MAPQRRQSSISKTVPQTATPLVIQTHLTRPAPPQATSKLKIHPLLEIYEATISSLIGTLSEDPFRPDSINDCTRRLLQCEQELEEALEEGRLYYDGADDVVKQHHENTVKILQLQRENAELSKLFSSNLTSLSEARTVLASLSDSQPATINSIDPSFFQLTIDKIPYEQILEYASKISKFTSPPPQWDPTRPQQPGNFPPTFTSND
jgi:tRNA(Ile)-lysidine synthase TilS/MesJ